MGALTHIPWCDSTLNFWEGCIKVSAGCANCYAEARDRRMMSEKVIHWGTGAPRRKSKSAVRQAFSLNRKPWVCDTCSASRAIQLCEDCGIHGGHHRRRIFSLSLGDWLDPEVPVEWLAEMLDTIRQCDACDWLLLTKRPELFDSAMLEIWHCDTNIGQSVREFAQGWRRGRDIPKNVWIGVSAEDQQNANKRIPELLKIPAKVRFLSVEPLLGTIDFGRSFPCGYYCDESLGHVDHPFWSKTKAPIDWVIVGGESGSNARPCNIDWIRSIKEQCQAARVPVFVKQLGSNPHCECGELPASGFTEMQHPKGGDLDEWPEDLRVRQFPK